MELLSACDRQKAIDALGPKEVTVDGVTVRATLRAPDREMFLEDEMGLIGRSLMAYIVTETKPPGLVVNAEIEVEGQGTMKVHRFMAESDGGFTRILCKKA